MKLYEFEKPGTLAMSKKIQIKEPTNLKHYTVLINSGF